jgi:hypothetical protein
LIPTSIIRGDQGKINESSPIFMVAKVAHGTTGSRNIETVR